MALSQVQIIQSLGEALSWFEKELGWGVKKAELRHLTGRIGELYAAMITRGQMALNTNEHGYDVISAENERISVKTITSTQHVAFKRSTFTQVDRVMVLRVNVDEDDGVSIESLLDLSATEALTRFKEGKDGYVFSPAVKKLTRPIENLKVQKEVYFQDLKIKQFENGTIQVSKNGNILTPTKPYLRNMATVLGIDLLFESGAEKNTRHLGSQVIKQLTSHF